MIQRIIITIYKETTMEWIRNIKMASSVKIKHGCQFIECYANEAGDS